jgi:hypothetical protein
MKDLNIQFAFKGPGFGRIGNCSVEVRKLNYGKAIVILTDSDDTGCGSVSESIASIATQFRQRHLRSLDPELITWVIHASAGRDEDHSYQKVNLSWDGERYDIPRQMARFNRTAFLSAMGETC